MQHGVLHDRSPEKTPHHQTGAPFQDNISFIKGKWEDELDTLSLVLPEKNVQPQDNPKK